MPLSASYVPNYFSIDDILATESRTPCKILQTIYKLGKINSSSEEDDLPVGTSTELPLWMVLDITMGRQSIVTVDLPKMYRDVYREILEADACAVNLYKLAAHFYEMGMYVLRFDDDRCQVANTLINAFCVRYRNLMDLAYNANDDPNAVQRLDQLEKELFKTSYEAREKLNAWLGESHLLMKAANMVINYKKRRRVDMF